MLRLRYFISAVATLGLLQACDKDPSPPSVTEPVWKADQFAKSTLQISTAYATASEEIFLAASQIDVLAGRPLNTSTPVKGCATTTIERLNGENFPMALRLTYAENCRDNAGKSLAGNLRATFSGPLNQRGTKVSIETRDFIYNQLSLSGNLSFEVQQANADMPGNLRQDLVNAQVQLDANNSFTYDETVFSLLTEGGSTNFASDGLSGLLDDIWTVNRTATIVDSEEITYALTSAQTLQSKVRCILPMEGAYSIQSPAIESNLRIQFGEGECDTRYRWIYQDEEGTGTL